MGDGGLPPLGDLGHADDADTSERQGAPMLPPADDAVPSASCHPGEHVLLPELTVQEGHDDVADEHR